MNSYAGVDVSKKSLEVCLSESSKSFSISNSCKAIQKLISKLLKERVSLVVCEATGGYEQQLVDSLHAAKICVSVINPGQARAFARSLGRKAKNDPIDASMLRLYAERIKPRPTEPLSPEIRQLKALVHRRAQVVDMIVSEKNRISAPGNEHTCDSMLRVVEVLKEEEKSLKEQIAVLIRNSENLTHKFEILTSIKGVGLMAAASLLGLLPELGKVNRKEIAALIGFAPYNNDSGNFTGKRRIAGGRALLRKIFYMAALTAIRSNPWLRAFYQRLVKSGKKKKVALAAAARKLIVALNSMVREDRPWVCPIKA